MFMKVENIKNFKNGWIIGNFEPSLLKTKDFEVGVHTYGVDHTVDLHFHKLSSEFNYIISGKMVVNGCELQAGDIFVLQPYELSDTKFLEETTIIIARNHSCTKDKYKVKIC